MTTGAIVQTISGVHSRTINACDWSPDGKSIVSCAADDRIAVTDVSRQVPSTIKAVVNANEKLSSCTFSPLDPSMLLAGAYQVVHAWHIGTSPRQPQFAHDGQVACLVAQQTLTGGALVATASHDSTVKLWSL